VAESAACLSARGRVVSMYDVEICLIVKHRANDQKTAVLTSSPGDISRIAMTCTSGSWLAGSFVERGNTATAFGSHE